MHEVGMLVEIAKTAARIAERERVERVKYVELEVGELSGVLPELFEQYYSFVTEDFPALKGSELRIHTVPGEALCSGCNALYNVMKNEGKCPRCESCYKTVLGGKDVMLQQIGY